MAGLLAKTWQGVLSLFCGTPEQRELREYRKKEETYIHEIRDYEDDIRNLEKEAHSLQEQALAAKTKFDNAVGAEKQSALLKINSVHARYKGLSDGFVIRYERLRGYEVSLMKIRDKIAAAAGSTEAHREDLARLEIQTKKVFCDLKLTASATSRLEDVRYEPSAVTGAEKEEQHSKASEQVAAAELTAETKQWLEEIDAN